MLNRFVVLAATLGLLAACGAKIETGNGGDSTPPPPQKLSSPETQTLKTAANFTDGFNQALKWDFAGGDLSHFFTFEPLKDGDLSLQWGSLSTMNCNTSQMTEIFRLETLVAGVPVSSVIITTSNNRQALYKGNKYRVKTTLYNLGKCEFISYDFTAKYLELVQP